MAKITVEYLKTLMYNNSIGVISMEYMVELLNEKASEMEWRDINKIFPQKGMYVLAFGNGGRQFTAYASDTKLIAYNPFNDEGEECEEVTHWMPLPNKPV